MEETSSNQAPDPPRRHRFRERYQESFWARIPRWAASGPFFAACGVRFLYESGGSDGLAWFLLGSGVYLFLSGLTRSVLVGAEVRLRSAELAGFAVGLLGVTGVYELYEHHLSANDPFYQAGYDCLVEASSPSNSTNFLLCMALDHAPTPAEQASFGRGVYTFATTIGMNVCHPSGKDAAFVAEVARLDVPECSGKAG